MSMVNSNKLAARISWIAFILLAIQTAEVLSSFTDVPPPPVRPQQFHSREELKRYLQLVHEYYAIIGRPRFGRSVDLLRRATHKRTPIDLFELNNEQPILPSDDEDFAPVMN